MNILRYIYDLLINDDFIKANVANRIYFYEVTENVDTSKPFIILSPIYDTPSSFVSDSYLSETYNVQVDVETYKDQTTIDITKRVRKILFDNNFYQTASMLDDYFKETKRYVKSRRYEGIPKNQYYKGEHIN
ncbi:hypothetical protein ISO99_04750 [Staphylococcus sp. 18_1_E_LY]|uniref:Phage protein n=1 Tax=Staphylococcus lloydii TaxID=2781774 RepID=A0A7T1AYQ0_9STAP|nr:hypothetical protein [Staphylococcus lloydii]MBF7019215.1 hypothetical protein [Staphylococcus lloydii]MBF7026943.1 hypothetical protein [Staphylococcus lloydii]QPM74592.1 hypothetical protein ISP08_09615 [Staphylococcus lloydii]